MHFAASIRAPTTGSGAELKKHGLIRAATNPVIMSAAAERSALPATLSDNISVARPSITGKSVAWFFLLCTLFDFVLGYIRGRTLPAAIGHVLFGLLSTFAFLLWWWIRDNDDQGE
jgi:hypothetical protein